MASVVRLETAAELAAWKEAHGITHEDEKADRVEKEGAPKELLDFVGRPHAYDEPVYMYMEDGALTVRFWGSADKPADERTVEVGKHDLLTVEAGVFHTFAFDGFFCGRGLYTHPPEQEPKVTFMQQQGEK